MKEESLEQIKKDVSTLTALIIQSRETIRKSKNKEDDLILAEDIIIQNLLIGKHLLDCEQLYRLKVKEIEASGRSNASAESEAKTMTEYYTWQRCKQVWGSAEECIRILKHASTY